jgi:transglutaminase-like putative cysteine protease
MDLSIEHRTSYEYSESVNYTIQQLRLTPQDGFGQHVKRWEVRVNGHLHRFDDAYGNAAHTLVLDNPHQAIHIVANGEVETGLAYQANDNRLPLGIFLRMTPLTEAHGALERFALRYQGHVGAGDGVWLDEMVDAIVAKVPYARGNTAVDTPASEAFLLGNGVCQDHAHIFVACCRRLGLPARYVSGYLFTEDGSLMESHAWADVWLGEAGWRSIDVSNQCRTGGQHVRLAVGLDYRDACPVSGVRVGGGMETMGANVRISQSGQVQQ